MAYQQSKNGEIIINGFESGISASPHKGIANLQNVNISTETGEVMASFGRLQEYATTIAGGTFSYYSSTVVSTPTPIIAGIWVNVGTGITGLSSGIYYISSVQLVGGNYNCVLVTPLSSTSYAGTPVSGMSTGTATYTIENVMALPIAKATESYFDGNNNLQYRYYILDSAGYIWAYDTGTATTFLSWFLPSIETLASWTPNGTITSAANGGLAVLNGFLMLFVGNVIACKPTVNLGQGWSLFSAGGIGAAMISPVLSKNPHFAITTHLGFLYYTDGNFIGSIFPTSSLLSTIPANVQSYCAWNDVLGGATGSISNVISGSAPTFGATSQARVPAVFFFGEGGTIPTNLTANTIYYILYANDGSSNFSVYTALTGGSAITLTGGTGTQYFNTFYPIGLSQAAAKTLMIFAPIATQLPTFEIATAIAELGTTLIIGTKGNEIYPWDGQAVTINSTLSLPERGVVKIITVNNIGYIFCGNKGNIYLTSGSMISAVISVPDYCAGIAGTPISYIEPYFTWLDCMYLRGRLYFSIIDQTASKAGNCGGIWSFIPTQNAFIQQDVGTSLRLENQNSYGTYNGGANLLIDAGPQNVIAPQYFTAWQSSISNPVYGIDTTALYPVGTSIIETDLIETGSMLDKKTFKQIEYKLATPLAAGESIGIKYRLDSTSAFQTCGTVVTETTQSLSGYFPANFEKTQWVQLQVTLNPLTTSVTSFCRLAKLSII